MTQPTTPREPVAASLLAVLRARWLVVAVVASVCVAVAAVLVFREPSRYTASADILVQPISSADDDFVGVQVLRDSVVAPSANVLTVARLVKTPGTAAIVARGPEGRGASTASLMNAVSVSPLSQTSIVVIGATASTPGGAAALANAFASATMTRRTAEFQQSLRPAVSRLRDQVAALAGKPTRAAERAAFEARLAVLQPLVGASDPTLSLLDPAEPPTSSSGPSPALVVPAALVGGILLGVLAALACELVDRRVRREEELGLDSPALVRVPASADRSRVVAATAFRDLRSRLIDDASSRPRTILVASAGDGDGKTAVAVQLAGSLAAAGRRVALVDGDFRNPSIAGTFGVEPPANGFDDLFGRSAGSALVRAPGVSPKLLLGLPTIRNGSQLARLDTRLARAALAKLERQVDVVVVDSGSLAGSSDALLLAKATDATVIAVRLHHSKRAETDRLRRLLAENDIRPAAVVVFAGGGRGRLAEWARAAVRSLSASRDSRSAAREPGDARGADDGSLNGRAGEHDTASAERRAGTRTARRPARSSRGRHERHAADEPGPAAPQTAEATAARSQ